LSTIQRILGREVLDSRGRPTVEAEVHLRGGHRGRAIAPSGASTGAAEALELRDGDPQRYDGRGAVKAVENVNRVIGPELIGMDAADAAAVDARLLELDGTPQKTRLGGNATVAVSLAVAHAAAASRDVPLWRHLQQLYREVCESLRCPAPRTPQMPLPMVNMISGGLHAGGNLDFQDFLALPVGAADYRTGLEWLVRTYYRLGELLQDAGYEGRLIGDEGGFGPRLESNRQAAEFLVRAIEAAGLVPGEQMSLALDVAATHFFDGQAYRLKATGDARLSAEQMVDQLAALVDEFPIISIEDGLAEEDWHGWSQLTRRLGDRVQIVGDDLLTTSPPRVRRAIAENAANSVLVKVNQIGTLSEALQTMALAEAAGLTRVVSARSGETEDTTIADLAVGVAAEQIKIGSIVRGERLAKYNQLLRIEEQLSRN